jgi:bacillolysin
MASVSGPGSPVNQPVPQQPAAQGTGTVSPQQSKEVAQAPAVAPQLPQNAFEGQTKRPSGEKLGAAVAGPNVPLPSMELGASSKPGPIGVKSQEGQAFVKDAANALAAQQQTLGPSGSGFTPRSVERDSLGMVHVRMDRTQNGVPVFGEQSIVHFGQDGKLRDITGDPCAIPSQLGKGQPKMSPEQAVKAATQEYGKSTDVPPTAQRVIAKGADGQYHDAYLVGTQRMTDANARPEKMQYLVDANTGKVIQNWNAIGGTDLKGAANRKEGVAGDPVSADASAAPKAKINDLSSVSSTIKIDKDMNLDSLKLDLDINHTYKGDLVVKLTSPSGKEYVVSNRAGGSANDIKRSFDVTSAFKSEPSIAGDWKLTVEDKARRDTGTLNSWALHAKGKEKGDPPPPPPPPPPGQGDDKSLYAGTVDLKTTRNADGTFSLNDTSRGKGVETRDANNRSSGSGATQIKDNNDKWGEAGDPARNAAAVDAHYGAAQTYDMLKNMFGRNSIDGQGEKLVSNVHINQNYVNAFWDGSQMNYGDGDGQNSSVLTSLDVAGHEIVHGLTERTSGLIYSGESGGLNEAMSDIIGGFGLEYYTGLQNGAVKAGTDPFKIGEQIWTPRDGNNGPNGDALRYMDDPSKDGISIDHYSKYRSGTDVHHSSGIANNAFSLLVKGGTNKTSGTKVEGGIGAEKALQIFFRANTTYMTPNTNFAQARQATIKAATDLYGANSPEVAKVAEAWTAVGVR